jgi:hypothetical protein
MVAYCGGFKATFYETNNRILSNKVVFTAVLKYKTFRTLCCEQYVHGILVNDVELYNSLNINQNVRKQ